MENNNDNNTVLRKFKKEWAKDTNSHFFKDFIDFCSRATASIYGSSATV